MTKFKDAYTAKSSLHQRIIPKITEEKCSDDIEQRSEFNGSQSAGGDSAEDNSLTAQKENDPSPSNQKSNQGVKETKKDKKLVFLSRSVLLCVRKHPMTTGTVIANEILQLYKKFSDKVDFKNVQRRVYDALNVLSAMEIISKYKN